MKQLVLVLAIAGCGAGQRPAPPTADRWLLTGTRLYVAPDAAPLDHAWVVVNGGENEALGAPPHPPPPGVRRARTCSGGVITAGFQNSHVHFSHPAFEGAAAQPREQLQPPITQMTTR